jgi:hypothetical protein
LRWVSFVRVPVRPDTDTLLASIHREEARARRVSKTLAAFRAPLSPVLALVQRISPTEHSLSLQTMNKNTIIILIGVFIAGALSASAQTSPAATPPAPSFSFVVTPAFVSQYMFRGVRLGGPSFEPNVEFDTGNLGLGVWANFPMQDKVPGQSDPEIDPYGYYTFAINDSLSIVPGFTWYNYPHADKGAGFYKSTFEPNIALNYTFAGVKLTPKLYYDLVLDGPTAELAVAYTVPLKEIGSELDFVGTGGAYKWKNYAESTTPKIKNWGDYWSLGVSLPFAVTKESKLTVGWAYTEGRDNFLKQGPSPKAANPAAIGRGVFTVSYAWTF